MLIEKRITSLTDGSKVYDLIVYKGGSIIELYCNSEKDVDDLQFKLSVLLSKHTTEQTIIRG